MPKIILGAICCLCAVILIVVNIRYGLFLEGISRSGGVFLRYAIPLLFLCFVMGQAEILVKKVDVAHIGKLLESRYGLSIAWIVGIFSPGSPPMFPLLSTLWEQQTGRLGVIAFLTFVPLLNLEVLLIRIPSLGWQLTLLAYAINIVLSLGVLLLFMLVKKFLAS